MAAFAALVSVMHIIQQIQNHPRPPISLDIDQLQSLTQNVTFLQDYLENYSSLESNEADGLNSRIATVAYAAEDVIESHIVDQIQSHAKETTRFQDDLYRGLQKVIQDLDLIKRDVSLMVIRETMGGIHLRRDYSSQPFSSTGHIGFDDVLIEIMDKLTGQRSNRLILPIVGMGGIGKTTLAKNVYVNPLIVQHFDFRGWATISQEYNSKQILLEVLVCFQPTWNKQHLSELHSEDKLGEMLYKKLSGRRYLIVMDDMWSNEAWEKVRFFFPDNNNGSGIIITTRLSNMASQLIGASPSIQMKFLDEVQSWSLLSKNVFGDESNCPLELEGIGKEIAKNCKGLPLSIAVIGGILAKSQRMREYWEYIYENLNSIVNSMDDERCLKILNMSYKELPVHLKPCFLYMGIFLEDAKIHVSSLIKLWVAEGFLKPIHGKSLEMVAEEYLNDLANRNLVLVDEVGVIGEMKICKMHDLLRDLCLRQIEKENFKCGEEMVKRVPNIKELRVSLRIPSSFNCLENLGRLQKLESLTLDWKFRTKEVVVFKWKNLNFPRSLKKLSLTGRLLDWDDMMTTIGSLPILGVLELNTWSVEGGFEWETVDGQFQSLKYLGIKGCDIEHWRTESTHFPCLERLVLELDELKGIPSEIGDIPTLKSIELKYCTKSAVISANEILKEQEELGNVDIHVRVWLVQKDEEIQRLSSQNFIVSKVILG